MVLVPYLYLFVQKSIKNRDDIMSNSELKILPTGTVIKLKDVKKWVWYSYVIKFVSDVFRKS